jgi:ABC-type branched-subunit amino acid transport system substrate-binding protein
VCFTALGLAACATLPQYGVATTTVTPHGNCDTSRVIPVGVALDLSGRQAGLGHEYLSGLEIAVEQVNHSRGVLRYHDCLELLYKDTRGDAHVAGRAVVDLVNKEGVAFLVSPLTPGEIQFAGPDLAKAVVPTASFSSLDQTYDPHRYPKLFPLAASSNAVAASMTSFARSQRWTRVGIVATDDPGRRRGAADLTQTAKRAGVVVTESVAAAAGIGSAASALRRLRQTTPDAVVVMGDSLDVSDVLKARASLGWRVPVVAQAVAADRLVVAAVGVGNLDDVFAVVPQAVVVQQRPLDPAILGLRDQVRNHLHVSRLNGSIIPYSQAVDAISMLAWVASGVHNLNPGSARTYLENANFQGLLASYSFTSDAHTGMGSDQLTVAPVTSLSDGLFGVIRSG